MSNFNKRSIKNKDIKLNKGVNNEGEEVFILNPLKSLMLKNMGSFFGQDTFYKKADIQEEYKDLVNLVTALPEEDKEYALKVAELGRLTGIIEYPLNTLSVCYNLDRYKGMNFVDDQGVNKLGYYNDAIVRRTKDINHLLATQFSLYGKGIPKQMRKNLKSKIESYDEYKLSKGLDRGKAVSLADSIKLLRPVPKTEEMAHFYKRVIENKVTVGNDKVQINAALNKIKVQEKDNKEIDTEDLIKAMYKANLVSLLKNLTVLLDYKILKDEKHLKYVCESIVDTKKIKSSKVYPYQLYAAYKSLNRYPNKDVAKLKKSLVKAMDLSINNVEDIEGYTCYLIDISGSMESPISNNSSITALEMACMLGAIAFKKGQGDLFAFSSDCVKVNADKNDSLISIMEKIDKSVPHHCTALDKAFSEIEKFAKKYDVKYDNLLILSDADCYSMNGKNNFTIGDWGTNLDNKYNNLVEQGIIDTVWLNNLTGNKYTVLNTDESKKNLIMGYSERFIDVMNLYYKVRNNTDLRPLIDELLLKYK